MNESRPGVSSAVLKPPEALEYLHKMVERMPEISVVGIAGPGDPFANPKETMETLRLVRDHYPEMLLCVASNGMNVLPYVDELAELQVSHITITVNGFDPKRTAQVYRWFRDGTQVLRGEAGAQRLLERQIEAISALKRHNLIVKVNTIIIPGVNDSHIEDVAREAANLGVDVLNCMPLHPAPGSDFEDLPEPSAEIVAEIRVKALKYLPQMQHCTRCRADAVGLLGDDNTAEASEIMASCCNAVNTEKRKTAKRIAVATLEGILVNQHLGNAFEFSVYENSDNGPVLVERRDAPMPGGGEQRWRDLADRLSDCHTVLVQYAGQSPRKILGEYGIELIDMDGLIDHALRAVFDGKPVPAYMTSRAPKQCGNGCGNSGGGCGA